VALTHLIGDQEKTGDQRFRFAEAKGRSQHFPLSSVGVTFGTHHAPIKQNGGELAGDGFDP